jgi:hypothetical protein
MGDCMDIMEAINYLLSTRKKRHIVGGALISVSFLFGGLALTVMTIKEDDDHRKDYISFNET